jgi:peptide/nickel transport system substrate-binding protein
MNEDTNTNVAAEENAAQPQEQAPTTVPVTEVVSNESVVATPPENEGEPELAPTPDQDQPEVTPKKGGLPIRTLVFGLIGLLVVGLIAGAVFAFTGDKDDSAKSSTVVANIALLRIGDTNGPLGADVLFPNEPAAQASLQIDFQVYEGLVGYSNQRIVPLLATSWTNPDSNTWIFKLKDGVTFHNGKTVTATDVKASLDALAKDEYWGQFMQTISSVSVSGQNEVTIKTASPDSLLLNRLAYGFVYQTNTDKTLSGTGAYTIDTANSKAEDKTRLVAYENYHQGVPKTKVIEYTIYTDFDAIFAGLKEGKIDLASISKNNDREQQLGQKNFSSTSFSASGAYGITMNMVKAASPLQKLEVRQALAYALDRASYTIDTKSVKFATNYVIPQAVVGYDETAKYPDVNSAKAKELLVKAGYPNGLPLTFNYINGIQNDVPQLVSILNKSGFTITAKAYPSPKEFVSATGAGNYDLFVGSFSSDLGDGLDIFAGLLGSETSQFPSYNNPAFDKMLSDASKAFNAEEHVKKVQEINRYVKDNSLWLPIANGEFSTFYPKNYNFTMDAVQGVNGMYFWKLGTTQQSTSKN